jgi:hypothetical protein
MKTKFGMRVCRLLRARSAEANSEWVLFLPIRSFLSTGATFGAEFNLVLQFMMGVALATEAVLAEQKR